MRIIEHRANGLSGALCPSAEIDVQIDRSGDVVVGHDLWEGTFKAEFFLKHSEHSHFLIDIKQNLPLEKLQLIAQIFGERSLGLFDVPFPSAYYARISGLDVMGRISEFEPVNYLFDKFWVDSLASQNGEIIGELISRTQSNHRLIIASPELHGHSFERTLEVWNTINAHELTARTGHHASGKVVGLVTKFPRAAEEFFNETR